MRLLLVEDEPDLLSSLAGIFDMQDRHELFRHALFLRVVGATGQVGRLRAGSCEGGLLPSIFPCLDWLTHFDELQRFPQGVGRKEALPR